ncbi:hypothetical protein PQX77_020934 [Marasmius sp. AFHP31]|nr:hypothetical protein PQX77_020934 [Marasmius sp. AFHP31]
MWGYSVSFALLALVATQVGVDAQETTVTVSANAAHPIPTTLWGQMFEDISNLTHYIISMYVSTMPSLRFGPDSGCPMSQSGDGGLYAELLQNRAFQLVTPGSATALDPWSAVNGAQISVVEDTTPVSSALPNSLNFVAPTGATGPVGVQNPGYWGIKVTSGSQYTASFFYRFPTSSSFNGPATISLQSSSGQVLGSTTVNLSGSQTSWKQVTATITPPTTASSTNNTFVVTVDGGAAAGQTIRFALFSLFPPTFKNRANGMRPDIAEVRNP